MTQLNLGSAKARIANLWQTWLLVWRSAHYWTLAWLLLLVIQGLLPVATVYLTKFLVDSLVAATKLLDIQAGINLILMPSLAMAGVLFLTEGLQGCLGWVRTVQAELIQDYTKGLVHQKSTAVDLAFYETPEYHDRLHQARHEASTRSLGLVESSGSLLQNSITLLAMSTVLLPYGIWLPLVLVVSTIPALYIVLIFNRRYHHWWQDSTAERRMAEYYDTFLTHNAIAAELRLFDLGSHFQNSYQTLRQKLRTERLHLLKQQNLAKLGTGLGALLITGMTLLWMIWQLLQGKLTLGDLALFYQAFNRGQSLLRSLLGNVSEIHHNTLFMGNLFEFLQIESTIVDPLHPISPPSHLSYGIRFRQVTFRYPNSERDALKNFDLDIPAGKVVAIVGDNGAGKSTLIKLLCRFYDPSSGSVEIDNVDIRRFGVNDLRRLITVLFQWPVPYQATAADNIAIGDLAAQPSLAEIQSAARGAGAHRTISRLPLGYKTMLGKSFIQGVDLSGGEWQRVALARAFLRRAQIIVLDEPTSAMDSWAEIDWLDRFRSLANGRTALVITHRFTLAMRADIIHVMRNGQIVESGNHHQLVAKNGIYAQSWYAQMQAEGRDIETLIESYQPELTVKK